MTPESPVPCDPPLKEIRRVTPPPPYPIQTLIKQDLIIKRII